METINQIFKSTEKWRYVGVLHEYPECKTKKNPVHGKIEGNYYIESRRLGDRNKVGDKYSRDAQILEKGLIKEPDNVRYMFYLAQSYMDACIFDKAIYWYKKRVEKGQWFEEVYYSLYRIATCMEKKGEPWIEVEKAFIVAWKNLPSRAEPLYEIAKHYRLANDFETGYKYAKLASKIPFPKDQLLFIFKSVYDYQVLDELSICAYYIGKHHENIEICQKLIKENLISEQDMKRVQMNMQFSKDKLKIKSSGGKKKIIFYVGYAIFEPTCIYGSELAIQLSQFYEIIVFGKSLNNTENDNLKFLNSNQLEYFYETNEVEACIISRYIHYFIEFPVKAKKTFIWLHDVCYHGAYNGVNLPNNGKVLVDNNLDNIKKIVTLTNWHSNLIKSNYKITDNKISIIGNGINETYFSQYTDFNNVHKMKIPYRFIYTSDVCRGLEQVVDYFEDIHKQFPLAELYVYRDIKSFDGYSNLLERIKKTNYIYYKGKLEQKDLTDEFIKSDIWLYPTSFSETFCMSGLEALRAGCYCITRNFAALVDTIGDRGVLLDVDPKTVQGKALFLEEVCKALKDPELRLNKQKEAFEWAKSQTWTKIGEEWLKLIE
jgi:glycosyltransferase involved in cell wall biosynthesis